jgi:hypothetical protein
MQIIAENDRGYIGLDGNEFIVGSKIADPPKVRLTSPTNEFGGGGGVLSANISRREGVACDGHQQVEIGFVRFEQSEAVRGEPGNPRGEFNVLLNVGGEDDAAMQRGLAYEADRVTQINPALQASFASLMGSAAGGSSSRLVSPNGQWWLQIQDDGNFVVYDASDPAAPTPVFDLWWMMGALAGLGIVYPTAAGS